MKKLLKYWKLLIALILIGLAIFIYQDKYVKEEAAYQSQAQQMEQLAGALRNAIEKNKRYADIQDDLEAAKAELDVSRMELYDHFPVEMKEEDQIMYVLYLETLFGTEINFSFNRPVSLLTLKDGTDMQGLLMQVNYETSYQGFKDMVSYLATDDQIVSVYDATIEYDAEDDTVSGVLTLIVYLMYNEEFGYADPDIAIPELGKDNIFE